MKSFNSRELMEALPYSEIAYYMPELHQPLEALQARINNELEVTVQLVHALKLVQCICIREHPYSGKGVTMCFKCRAMVLYEMLTEGESKTQKEFDKVIP